MWPVEHAGRLKHREPAEGLPYGHPKPRNPKPETNLIAIPKKLHEKLGLVPGDYLEVEREDDRLVLTPKMLVEKRLAEGLKDIKEGRPESAE